MGNCLKSGSNDDVSLLRGNYVHPDPSDPNFARAHANANANAAASSQRQGQAGPGSATHQQSHSHRRRTRSEQTDAHEAGTAASNNVSGQTSSNDANQSGQYFYVAPNVRRSAQQLTEEEQIKIAKRIGLISHLPTGVFDGSNENEKQRECIICMCDYAVGDQIRFLPCMHAYHRDCVDDWLMRSFTCPSCLEPVDSALLTSYENSNCAQPELA